MKSLKGKLEHRAQLHSFLIYAFDHSEWLIPCPGHTLRKQPQHPLNRRLGREQSWSRRFGEYKNLLPPTGIQIP